MEINKIAQHGEKVKSLEKVKLAVEKLGLLRFLSFFPLLCVDLVIPDTPKVIRSAVIKSIVEHQKRKIQTSSEYNINLLN